MKRIFEKAKERFSTENYWEWEPTGSRSVTGRTCPLSNHDAASFLPLFESYFYYTTRNQHDSVAPGDRILYIQHNVDAEFAADDGHLYSLDANDRIKPASEQASSELAVSLIVNLDGRSLSWSELDSAWDGEPELYPYIYCGKQIAGYSKAATANEWALAESVELEGHSIQIVASASPMESLVTDEQIDTFLANLEARVDALPIA